MEWRASGKPQIIECRFPLASSKRRQTPLQGLLTGSGKVVCFTLKPAFSDVPLNEHSHLRDIKRQPHTSVCWLVRASSEGSFSLTTQLRGQKLHSVFGGELKCTGKHTWRQGFLECIFQLASHIRELKPSVLSCVGSTKGKQSTYI